MKKEVNQPFLVKYMCCKSGFKKQEDIPLPFEDRKFSFYKSRLGKLAPESGESLKRPCITKPRGEACGDIDLSQPPEQLESSAL